MSFTKQLLEHGKLLTAAAFPTFVETWNWLVNGFSNLKGDGDINPDEGFVKVDKTVPNRPVIRLINRNKLGGGGGGGGGVEKIDGPFEPVFGEGVDGSMRVFSVGSGFVPFGRQFYFFESLSSSSGIAGGVGLKIVHPTTSGGKPTVSLVQFGQTVDGSLRNVSPGETTLPLYEVNDGKIVKDYRCYLALAIRE